MVCDMDPTETFSAMMEAFRLGLLGEASEYAGDLSDWLNKGGFSPKLRVSIPSKGDGGFIVSPTIGREFCLAACREILHQQELECDPHQ